MEKMNVTNEKLVDEFAAAAFKVGRSGSGIVYDPMHECNVENFKELKRQVLERMRERGEDR
jgi:hypothetical protein